MIDANLRLCYPHLPDSSRENLLRENLRETGKNLTELGPFWLWPRQRVSALIVEQFDRDIFDQAIAKNKGVILAAPHTGAWELIQLFLASTHTMHFLYRPNRIASLDKPLLAARERFGGTAHPINRRGLSALVKALKAGEVIGILPDQEPAPENGVCVPLFGVPAYTMTFMANLASRTGAPVVFTVMERLRHGKGYRLRFLSPDKMLANADPEVSAAALNRCVERCIAISPAQYMWSYKRFKHTPAEFAPEYRRVPARRKSA